MLVEVWMVKANLMRPQTKMKITLLEIINPCLTVQKNMAELCSCLSVLLKLEFVSNKIGYLAEEISKQNVEGAGWLLWKVYSKMQEDRNNLKMKFIIHLREAEFKRFGKFSAWPSYKE